MSMHSRRLIHVVDYLLKPFSKDRFDKAIEKFLDQASLRSKKKQLMYKKAPPESSPLFHLRKPNALL